MRIVIDLDREENQGYVYTGELGSNRITLDAVFVVESWEDDGSYLDFWQRREPDRMYEWQWGE